MSNNFAVKLFYVLFMLIGIQFAYAGSVKKVTISFTFLYTQGIESVYFDQTNMGVQNSVAGNFTVTDSSSTTGYTLTVKTDVENGANSITKNFNNESQRMEAGGSATNASSLDFLFDGILEINGRPIGGSRSFTLAHENYKSSNSDWWIADTSGNASLYGSGTSTSMTVEDDVGNYYCLSQNGTNYQILVTVGQCDGTNPYSFTFDWGNKLTDLSFEPLNSYESGQIGSISLVNYVDSTTNTVDKSVLTINAQPLNSSDIAKSFLSLMSYNVACNKLGTDGAYHFQIYLQGLACGPDPENLDFYIAGYLKIDGRYALDTESEATGPYEGIYNNRIFILAHGENRWWLGTLSNPFERYGGGGATYNNHITVKTTDYYKYWYEYNLKATSDNSFTVKYSGDHNFN